MTATANPTEIHQQIRAFGAAYDYDSRYLATLLDGSPTAYETFTHGQAMSVFREALPLDAHYVARVATMQAEDCGPCAQLNLRMAVEAGVDRELLATLIEDTSRLPEALRDVAEHAFGVASGQPTDPERAERIRQAYGAAAFAELAVCIAGCRIYPTLKRSLAMAGVCERLTLDF